MEKHIERLLEAKKRDWDFCIIYTSNRSPIYTERATRIGIMESGMPHEAITLDCIGGDPTAQTEADAQKTYNITTILKISTITGIDFYVERRIATPNLVVN